MFFIFLFKFLHNHFDFFPQSDVKNNRFGTLLPDVL